MGDGAAADLLGDQRAVAVGDEGGRGAVHRNTGLAALHVVGVGVARVALAAGEHGAVGVVGVGVDAAGRRGGVDVRGIAIGVGAQWPAGDVPDGIVGIRERRLRHSGGGVGDGGGGQPVALVVGGVPAPRAGRAILLPPGRDVAHAVVAIAVLLQHTVLTIAIGQLLEPVIPRLRRIVGGGLTGLVIVVEVGGGAVAVGPAQRLQLVVVGGPGHIALGTHRAHWQPVRPISGGDTSPSGYVSVTGRSRLS